MAGLHPRPGDGLVNGLARPSRFRRRQVLITRKHTDILIVAGIGLYGAAVAFPLLLQQVTPPVFGAAAIGTALLIAGLHVRWKRGEHSRE